MKTKIAITATIFTFSALASANANAEHYNDNSYCREFTKNIAIGGRTEHAYGTACRQPDGSWQIVNENESHYDERRAESITYVIDNRPIYVRPRSYSYTPAFSFAYNDYDYRPRKNYRKKYFKKHSRHERGHKHGYDKFYNKHDGGKYRSSGGHVQFNF